MTEQEAKQKWCPMVRDIAIKSASVDISSAFCKGSDCMMWKKETRWVSGEFKFTYDNGIFTCIDGPEIVGGYCGLAGKP